MSEVPLYATAPPSALAAASSSAFPLLRVQGLGSEDTLETTQGQIDGFLIQIPFTYYLPEVASFEICQWVASRMVEGPGYGNDFQGFGRKVSGLGFRVPVTGLRVAFDAGAPRS